MASLQNEVSSLMKQVNQGKASLDSKDERIGQLEKSLKDEEQKVSVSIGSSLL